MVPALAAATAVIVPIFGLIAFFFVPMGQLVGWYLENSSNGTLAYSVNVFAALCGIISYTVFCFLYQPPAIWLLAGGILLLLLVWRVPRFRLASLVVIVICVAILELRPPKDTRTYSSTYQKLTIGSSGTHGKLLGYY